MSRTSYQTPHRGAWNLSVRSAAPLKPAAQPRPKAIGTAASARSASGVSRVKCLSRCSAPEPVWPGLGAVFHLNNRQPGLRTSGQTTESPTRRLDRCELTTLRARGRPTTIQSPLSGSGFTPCHGLRVLAQLRCCLRSSALQLRLLGDPTRGPGRQQSIWRSCHASQGGRNSHRAAATIRPGTAQQPSANTLLEQTAAASVVASAGKTPAARSLLRLAGLRTRRHLFPEQLCSQGAAPVRGVGTAQPSVSLPEHSRADIVATLSRAIGRGWPVCEGWGRRSAEADHLLAGLGTRPAGAATAHMGREGLQGPMRT